MSMQVIYMGEFVSRHDNSRWRVSILQEQEAAPSVIGQLEFPGEEPLLIEWPETSKEDVLCGSTATLKVISPGDRTFAGLYTIQAGNIGIRIEKDGNLYWMGTLDPEFYEEPYTANEDYEVMLTFSDFGIFERLSYNLAGMQTLETIVRDALGRAKIIENLCQDLISTQSPNGSGRMSLADLSVRSENFTDEDGEVNNMKEVLEGILLPLGIRMIQRGGKVWFYDLNGIYQGASIEKIEWHDDDQMMGVDKVANNVKISFSPYASGDLLSGDLKYDDDYSVEDVNLSSAPGANHYSYYPDYSDEHRQGDTQDYNLVDFTIFFSRLGRGLAYLHPSARYCHVLPVTGSAQECTAIAWSVMSGGHRELSSGLPKQVLNSAGRCCGNLLMRTERAFLPSLTAADAGRYYVRLLLEVLLDARYNPFTDGTHAGNEEPNYELFKEFTAWAFIPVGVTLYDAAGTAKYHYVNRPIAKGAALGHIGYAKGCWESGAANYGDAFIAYYSTDDQEHDTGILGWKKNRHCIGRPDNEARRTRDYYGDYDMGSMFDSFLTMEDGEYIPYPPEGGFLEVTVFCGVDCYDYGEGSKDYLVPTTSEDTIQWDDKRMYEKVRWLLYKAPKVEIVRNNLVLDVEQHEDVEYKGWLNRDAKEDISLETICGTLKIPAPSAKGVFYGSSNGLQILELTRQGRTDQVERLLIGTLYSQFASRHTKLSGTAFLLCGGLKLYTDKMQEEKKFIMLSDLQDVDAGTSEMAVVELSPDEYDAVEYEE